MAIPPEKPQPAPKALIVLNPLAGGGYLAEKTQADLQTAYEALVALEPAHPEVEFFTGTPETLREKLEREPGRYERIIAAGGDGTITCTIAASKAHQLPVGIIPLGTGNRVARLLNIPTDPAQALHTALTGIPYEMDVMSVNGEPSILTADAGIVEAIMRRTNRRPQLKKLLGILAYPLMAIGPILKRRAAKFRLTFDGRTMEFEALGVAVVNGGEMAGYSITPDAKNNDGILDVAVLAANGDVLKTIFQLLGQTPGSLMNEESGLITFQTKEILIDTANPKKRIRTGLDGDPFGKTPLHVTLAGKATVFVPDPDKAG